MSRREAGKLGSWQGGNGERRGVERANEGGGKGGEGENARDLKRWHGSLNINLSLSLNFNLDLDLGLDGAGWLYGLIGEGKIGCVMAARSAGRL